MFHFFSHLVKNVTLFIHVTISNLVILFSENVRNIFLSRSKFLENVEFLVLPAATSVLIYSNNFFYLIRLRCLCGN